MSARSGPRGTRLAHRPLTDLELDLHKT